MVTYEDYLKELKDIAASSFRKHTAQIENENKQLQTALAKQSQEKDELLAKLNEFRHEYIVLKQRYEENIRKAKEEVRKAEEEKQRCRIESYDNAVLELRKLNQQKNNPECTEDDYKRMADEYKILVDKFRNLSGYKEADNLCSWCEKLIYECSPEGLKNNKNNKKDKKIASIIAIIVFFIQICLTIAYLYILFGTDIISANWTGIAQSVPLAGFSLLLGVMCFIFIPLRKSDDGFSFAMASLIIITLMPLVQAIIISSGFFSILIDFVVNCLMSIPGFALCGVVGEKLEKYKLTQGATK